MLFRWGEKGFSEMGEEGRRGGGVLWFCWAGGEGLVSRIVGGWICDEGKMSGEKETGLGTVLFCPGRGSLVSLEVP